MIRLSNFVAVDNNVPYRLDIGGDNFIVSDIAYMRCEPAFVFEKVTIEILWYDFGTTELIERSLINIDRSTIALFISIPSNGKAAKLIARFCLGGDEITSVKINDWRNELSKFYVSMVANLEEKKYCYFRHEMLGVKFGQLIENASICLSRYKPKLIFITGSVGKTSTKEFLAHLLEGQSYYASVDSWNFPHEICIQIIMNAFWAKVLVFEVSVCNYLHLISRRIVPDVFIFTHLGKAHTSLTSNIEDIGKLKAEIARNMSTQGVIIYNNDIQEIGQSINSIIENSPQIINYGSNLSLMPFVKIAKFNNGLFKCSNVNEHFEFIIVNNNIHYKNVVAAYLAYRVLFPDKFANIQVALETFKGVPGRVETMRFGKKFFIHDAYNANPISVHNLICMVTNDYPTRKKCLIFGEMLDLGTETYTEHSLLMSNLSLLSNTTIYLIGPVFEFLFNSYTNRSKPPTKNLFITCLEELLHTEKIREIVQCHDLVAIKGSNSTGILKLIPMLLAEFNNIYNAC